MIFRRPFSFLIKNFKVIHLVMFAIMGYITFIMYNIRGFFVSLQVSNTYIYAGADVYINNLAYLFIFTGLTVLGLLYWMLVARKKESKIYLIMIIWYVLTFVAFIYEYGILRKVTEASISEDTLFLARDIATLISFPGMFFAGVCLIRGFGINIKQFNFSKDIRELKLADENSEEFEVVLGQNNYKYARGVRRFLRETKYYFLEHLFMFSMLGLAMLAIIIGFGIYYYQLYIDGLKQSEVTTVNGIDYVVNAGYITAENYRGDVIKDGYKFVVVNISVNNRNMEASSLPLNLISLTDGKLNYYPTQLYNESFYDLGVPYKEGDLVASGKMEDYTLTFEIPKTTRTRNYTLRIQEDIIAGGRDWVVQYKRFNVSAVDIDSKDMEITKNVNELIDVNVINKNRFTLTVNGAKPVDTYQDPYIVCRKDFSCIKLSEIIRTQRIENTTMYQVDFDGIIYDDANFTKTFKNYNLIFNNYATIIYQVGNKEYHVKGEAVSNSNVDGKVFLNVNRRINQASRITIKFDFRNTKVYVPIKSPEFETKNEDIIVIEE